MQRAPSVDACVMTFSCTRMMYAFIRRRKLVCSVRHGFLNHTAERKYPDALIDGKEATVDEAIAAAAEHLYQADMPLVYGMSNTTCEAQRECVRDGRSSGRLA